ncbi:hypothetical protein M501DRAFT_998702 [Patellaria atrata CBS 101060]|uniref:Formin binding protein n=1 Tax=Patellaria atrata CBS 101060 TaxID=1346257 RepID=A0A9P4VW70_9PEZI|nr:hypothetical protein M501DRAFT_998702 [Patellaria atrata CBS 101060]
MNGAPAAPGLWQEARHSDGRTYYYNTQTKVTQWTKPEVLMTPLERALANQPWKEYTAEGGKKYWYNTETKKSSWEMPEVYKQALAHQPPPSLPPTPAQTFVAGAPSNFSQSYTHRDRDDYNNGDHPRVDRPQGYAPAFVSQAEPEYSSAEDAEAAFFKLLKRVGVQPDWTWEDTVKATIKDPQYRAIKDPKDRKIAFGKYIVEVKSQERDKEKERLAKLQADFTSMLRSHPEIKYYTRWKTARPMIEGETVFRAAKEEEEKKRLFYEYIGELRKAHLDQEAATRRQAMDELMEILGALDLEPYTRWAEAQGILSSNERFTGDEKFKSLQKSDILKAFENHNRSLERSWNDAKQKKKLGKARRERQARDQFRSLLADLRTAGRLKAGSRWMNIRPLIENDTRYTAALNQSGSSPMDMFWDVVEEEERVLRGKRSEVLDVLEDIRYEITPKTTLEDFVSIMQTDRRTANFDPDSLTLIFERLREKVLRRSEEDKHHAERHQRRAIDALRSKIKHLEPPVALGDTWEQVRSRIEKLEEYRTLDSDELRRSAFEKVMRRLKEKDEEDKDRSRRDHRDRDRERDRDYRNGHATPRRRRTRTPEADPYEADRRKAQADREQQYRRGGVRGLSPPKRDSYDRYDRGSSRQVSQSHYDRERREREAERERSYISRADPRDKASELDYGDSRPGSTRRRRDSEGDSPDSRRDTKRTRRERLSRERTVSPGKQRSKTPPAQPAPPAEDPAVRSGSEEGEIEED